ncbi:hypothetical protein NQ318_021677 [Aromia moschata]|uniref:General transcription factor 3C polypeptide 1 n=1 Tax=Aromia moschata TaxID=1265417 RepID=A0AAV8YF18_9CUCU|nr:hypothetical protein NQ318_021677 [Aromia moschata]
MEMAYELPNIYEHKLVNHPTIQGSSATFDTRNDITSTVNKLSLKTAEKTYGRALVMVATQELRRNALFNESADPTIELQNLEYCILEIIGRSRKHGELTQGNMSISSHFNMDPKSVFHYKKQLYQNNLLAKQFFYIKSAVTDQNKTGRLLHLKRFYHAMKPKQLLIAERIINILKTKPGYRLEYGELRKIFADNHQSVLYPYRALYPNAKKSEYMRKARPTEKCIRCMELIDPYINIVANWSNDQADSDEEDDDGALGEITINGETLSRKRKRHAGPPLPLLSENSGKGKESDKKLLYMGNNPVTILSEKNDEIFVDIISRELSERVMSRIRTILNIVQERKIFEDIHKLLKIIEEIEIAEGYKKKIDRKSLARILSKLVTEGYVKIYKLIICNGKITKTQTFLCHPSVTHTNSIIQSAYQQLKWKYFLGTQKKTAKPYVPSIQKEIEEKLQHGTSPFRESDVMNSIAEMREMNKLKYSEIKSRYNQQVGKSYGFKPKFIRMRVIHEVLFYLIYSYDKQSVPLTNDEVADLFRSYRIDLTEEDLEKMPKIYCKEMSWKMFIPPLPYHKGWIEGWALVCDVILRLPISVLCKVHNLSYEMNEIRDILNHPIKRFYLVKDLPVNIRNAALFKRKYLFDIHETLCRLAYCGLLQFGPQKYKEKDQVFIYLNRQGALLDTTTTEPSYHKITLKEYKQLAFYFQYPSRCLSTKLNAKQPGQLVTLVDVSAKPELLCAIKSKTPEEALLDDNGEIPGDRRGAAGLDSSLWAHIMRNWFWANKKVRPGNEPTAVMGLRKEKLEKILPQNLPFNELHISQSNTNKFYLHIAAKGGRDTQLKYKKTLRTYFDHVDKAILKRIGRMMKVRWNKKEDAILVMCKAASILLNPKNTKKQLVPYTTVRDVLHRTCPESRNKTSRLKESELSVAFIILMAYMVQHKEEVENLLQGNTTNINHLADNNLEYVERNMVEVEQNSLKYQEAKEEDDIKKDVLKTVVHSSLESKNHPGWAFQLFKIYQKYPDNLIRDAVGELKHSQTISFKKMMSKKDKARCHLPFQLSNIYVFSQSTTFNLTTAVEAYKTFLNIKENNKFLDFSQDIVDSKKYGQLLGLNEFCSYWEKFRMKFFLPHNTVILNPHVKDHGELVNELAVRWQLKLKNMQQENADAELEPEMEAECDRSDTNKPDVHSSQKEGGKSTSSHNKPKAEDYGVEDSGPLDLTVDTGNLETIDRLKTWVTDCMETAKERRSPSPDFITAEDYNYTLADGQSDTDAEDEDEHNETEGFKLTCDAEIEKMNLKVAKKMHDKDKIPSLEEIREGMLQSTSPQEKRKIPYITDLSFLLNESFPDLNKDEKTLERLKNHFITQYALLEDIIINPPKCLLSMKCWQAKGGTQSEFALADEVLAFVYEKKELGATGPQIKEYFHVDTNSLEMVVKVLVDERIFLKAGICSITFVHYLYQSIWIIETFVLTNDEQRALEETTTKVKKEVRENIDKQLSNKKRIRVKVVPWTKVDGSLNEESLKNWLCNILSHCLDYPNISLKRLCEKFCYVKPVDIHRLLEVLQELGCVEIMVYEETNPDLFTTWGSSKERPATILDSLDDMYIAPNNASMTYMGLFFCDLEE